MSQALLNSTPMWASRLTRIYRTDKSSAVFVQIVPFQDMTSFSSLGGYRKGHHTSKES
jgi:hypothetical protein